MKKIIPVLSMFTLIVTAACAQKITVPEKVSKAFKDKFPNASDVKWGKENAKEYEAEFKLNGTAISANFYSDGSWTETESTIKTSELPAPVTTAIKTKYPAGEITLAEKVEKPGKTYYETVVKTNGKKKEVEISPDGKFL